MAADEQPLGTARANQEESLEPQPSQLLPFGLRAALQKAGWKVIHAERLNGGFAASLMRLRLKTQSAQELKTVYKQFAPGRAEELRLYSGVLQQINGYAPKLLLSVQGEEEQGILLEDVGRPLKEWLRKVTDARQNRLLQAAVTWMAAFHSKYEEQSRKWVASGLLGVYPVDSSHAWANEALGQLLWLKEQGLCGIDSSESAFVQTVIERLYPQYAKWLGGRATLTHGDPHMENVLCQGLDGSEAEGKGPDLDLDLDLDLDMRLIDWEYTCVTVPQRDLSIFVQDILEPNLHEFVVQTYWDSMRNAGWRVDEPEFRAAYLACLLDNTLMMLGWEIYKFREHYLESAEVEEIVAVKLGWLQRAFTELFG